MPRNASCAECALSQSVNTVCMWGKGPSSATGMVVGDAPTFTEDALGYFNSETDSAWGLLRESLAEAGVDISDLYITHTVKCNPPKDIKQPFSKYLPHVRTCGDIYLREEIGTVKPKAILSLGASAWWHFNRRQGIMKHRGKAFIDEASGAWVMPTYSPSMILAQPDYYPTFQSDLLKFSRLLRGEQTLPKVHLIEVKTVEQLEEAISEVRAVEGKTPLTFDVETRGFGDRYPGYSKLWMIAFTRGTRDAEGIRTWMVPLEHPEGAFTVNSPLVRGMSEAERKEAWGDGEHTDLTCDPHVMRLIGDVVAKLPCNGHNVKFDIRHIAAAMQRYGFDDLYQQMWSKSE